MKAKKKEHKRKRNINIINNENYQNININKSSKSKFIGPPPRKRRIELKSSKPINIVNESSKKYNNEIIKEQNNFYFDNIKEGSFDKIII